MTSGTASSDETTEHSARRPQPSPKHQSPEHKSPEHGSPKQDSSHHKSPHRLRRIALSVLLFAFVFHFFVLPVFSNFGKTWKTLGTINIGIFLIAVLTEGMAWFFAAEVTRRLLPADQRPARLFMYEANLAANGVSEVLPGGVAATAILDYGLLRKVGVTRGRIVYALGAAGTIGIVTMIGLGVVSVLATASRAKHLQGFVTGAVVAVLVLVLVAVVIWAIINRTAGTARLLGRAIGWIPGVHRHSVETWVTNTAHQLHELLSDRRRLAQLVAVTAAQWICEGATAWVVFAALGHHLNVFELFLAYAIAVGMGAVPISPGGLGVFEGTMIAVLVAFGLDHSTATAGVLAFRLINYWLPIPLGALAYWLANRSANNAGAPAS